MKLFIQKEGLELKQHKGIISLDFLFSIIPVILMLVYILGYSSYIVEKSQERIENQILFDKLVSISDYIVKYKGAEKIEYSPNFGNSKVYPNLINNLNFELENLKEEMGLEKLEIGFSKGKGNCIYRFVVYQWEIKKLYVCGA